MFPAPAFEIGIWNAWILLFYLFLLIALAIFFYKGSFKRSSAFLPSNKFEKKIMDLWMANFYLAILYSIFLPLQLGTAWFYLGFPICLFGLIMYTIVWINIITTPLDEPITKGLYRYSRHPSYLITALIFIGVSIASTSWVFLLFSIIIIISSVNLAIPKERFFLEKYGKAYHEHLNKTPRWVGIPKSEKRDKIIYVVKITAKIAYYPIRLLLTFIPFRMLIRYWFAGAFFYIYMFLLLGGIIKLFDSISKGNFIIFIFSLYVIFLAALATCMYKILDIENISATFFILFAIFNCAIFCLSFYYQIDPMLSFLSLVFQGFNDPRIAILLIIFTIALLLMLNFITRRYFISDDDSPETVRDNFLRWLRDKYDILWAEEDAKILISDDGKTISISKAENYAQIINNEKKIKILKISDGRTYQIKEVSDWEFIIDLFFIYLKKIFRFYMTL